MRELKNNEVKVVLNQISDVKDFVEIVRNFTANVNLIKDSYIVDGASILGIFSLDCSRGAIAQVESSKEEEIAEFKKLMERFM